jgi:hypothetical protein
MQFRSLVASFLAVLSAGALHAQQQPAKLELKGGDHIAIVGNALADRLQHSSWLETLIEAKFPQQKKSTQERSTSALESERRS